MKRFFVRVTRDGQCDLVVVPEASEGDRARCAASATVQVVLDGRFDNSDELVEAFAHAGRPIEGCADQDILLRAYELWGAECVTHLLGDFAFGICDRSCGRLICARDALGSRPLFVHVRDGCVAAASDIASLLVRAGVARAPNEAFLAECLNGRIVHDTDTVWRDIARLSPGHVLVAEHGRVTTHCYWRPDPGNEIRHATDQEYGEHLAELIRLAVRARLRDAGRMGVMLSGGLDSSALVGALHDIQYANAAHPLATFSVSKRGAVWDESPYMDAVAEMWPIVSECRTPFEGTPEFYAAQAVASQDLPPYPNGQMSRSIFSAARDAGVRTLLTGFWSDEWLSGSFLHYADLIRAGRFVDCWRHLRAQTDHAYAFRPDSLFRAMIWPVVPPAARRVIKRSLGRNGVAPWLTRAFAARTSLTDRVTPAASPVQFASQAKTESYAAALSAFSIRANESDQQTAAAFGIETRHPYGDRRVLEFGLALPEDQRWRGQYPKFVLRTAARDWVPPAVRDRFTCVGASSVIVAAVRTQFAAGLWDNAVTVGSGWVDAPALRLAFEDMMRRYRAADEGYQRLALPLWHACGAEIFARHVLEGSHG